MNWKGDKKENRKLKVEEAGACGVEKKKEWEDGKTGIRNVLERRDERKEES